MGTEVAPPAPNCSSEKHSKTNTTLGEQLLQQLGTAAQSANQTLPAFKELIISQIYRADLFTE